MDLRKNEIPLLVKIFIQDPMGCLTGEMYNKIKFKTQKNVFQNH